MLNVLRNSGRAITALAVVFAVSLASNAVAADKGSVSGKVTKDGAGVAGANVVLIAAADVKAPAAAPVDGAKPKPKPVAKTKTESDGSFKLADVPAGDYIVRANAKEQGMARSKVTVKAGETAEVSLALAPGKGGKKKESK